MERNGNSRGSSESDNTNSPIMNGNMDIDQQEGTGLLVNETC